jgi:hypothetical protein
MLLSQFNSSSGAMSKRNSDGSRKFTRTVSLPNPMYRKKQYIPRKKIRVSPAVRQFVKSAIVRQAEKKSSMQSGSNIPIVTANATSPAFIELTPNVSQGVGQANRIGNKITVTKGEVRGHINLLPYNNTTNPSGPPVLIKMWLCRYKTANTTSIAGTNVTNGFFDTGNAITGFNGTMQDMNLFPNTDSWSVLKTKTFKLGAASGTTDQSSTLVKAFDNGPYSVPFYFEYGSHLGTVLFNDNNVNTTNKNLFLLMQAISATGTPSGGYFMAEYHFASNVEFVDT